MSTTLCETSRHAFCDHPPKNRRNRRLPTVTMHTGPALPASACAVFAPSLCPDPTPCTLVLDWDDTLLSTSWLSTWVPDVLQPGRIPPEVAKALDRLQCAVHHLLTCATKQHHVFIVTNSEAGWVELTAATYFPSLNSLLTSGRITVISARSSFEKEYPASPAEWKTEAILRCLKEANGQHPTPDTRVNLVSVGDGLGEREGAHRAVIRYLGSEKAACNANVKTVKFVDRPLNAQLRSEVELIAERLDLLCAYNGDTDIFLSVPLPEPGTVTRGSPVTLDVFAENAQRPSCPPAC